MQTKQCKNCGSSFVGRSSKQHCSPECFSMWRRRPEVVSQTVAKRKNTSITKYGVDNPAKNKAVIEKAKATCVKKYGTNSPSQNTQIKNKQTKTLMDKYGVDNPQKSEGIKQKQQETMRQRYGVAHPLQSPDIIQRVKDTNIITYGTDNPAKNQSVQKKIRDTNVKRYGTASPVNNVSVKEKLQKSRAIAHYNNIKSRCAAASVELLFQETDYTDSRNYQEYPVKCTRCSNVFNDCFTHGHIPRCIKCFPVKASVSKHEDDIANYIKENFPDITVDTNNKTVIGPHELDIYIPSKKIAIELNGNYWHSELAGKKYKNYHLNKTKKCEDAGILLVHVFEDEWIHKKEIIKSKINALLSSAEIGESRHARKCEIRVIDSHTSNSFLDQTHLQGRDNAPIRYGAYFGDELVGVMTFGKLRIALGELHKDGCYELYRFCTKGRIVGLLSKFIARFKKDHSPKKIITYADRRFSSPEKCGYSRCGFKLVKETTPNYWYMNKNYDNRIHRFNFRKSNLKSKLASYDSNLTEWENMQANGYDRIWDCGHLRYEMET